jgi:iron complex outermembrane receptor protein
MMKIFKSMVLGGACTFALGMTAAQAAVFDVPGGDLESALNAFTAQSKLQLVVSSDAIRGVHTRGAKGDLAPQVALAKILAGTGFTSLRDPAGALSIVRGEERPQSAAPVQADDAAPVRLAAAASASVETVVVTSSKIKGDIQTVPIAITALSQEQLTSRQIAGGPDLVKEVPNLTFTKTNFTGYSIQIRGIGTQAISVTTDPAVAVAFNDIPFIRNHFFEQEFFDVSQVEVVRGPQGTLYGRNATAGVVNMISAKPTDHYEAQISADWGNYDNRRYEGMLNIPFWSDKIDLRVAGEWTKRDGYAYNDITQNQIDGRDLFTTRASLLVHPFEKLTATAIWEHFQENDNRARSTKQLCERDNIPAYVDGPAGSLSPANTLSQLFLTQGCRPASLYSAQSYQTPNSTAIPFVTAFPLLLLSYISNANLNNAYATLEQSQDLRRISSEFDPAYRAKNDTLEFNVEYDVTPELTFTSQTGYNKDFLYSTEDYNRFTTSTNFLQDQTVVDPAYGVGELVGQDSQYCDPQLGCSSRFEAADRSSETARQFYQELRLSSNFQGPLNFIAGANYLSYHTTEDYYVFSNLLSLITETENERHHGTYSYDAPHMPFDATLANSCGPLPADPATLFGQGFGCAYIDPNPIDQVDGQGHNYFLSHNPYQLKSWAGFGEVYYQISPDVKLTGGLRYTDDVKNFQEYPSWTTFGGMGYPQEGAIQQEWRKYTGRAVVNWSPKLDFTDQTMVYASYSHGYKGGGANPPGVVVIRSKNGRYYGSPGNLTHPLTFKPEFVDAFEVGTKNTALDGDLTFNADAFLYKYQSYQISQIVDRTAVNLNFNATVMGAELQSTWSPLPGLSFGFNGGYERATFDSNQYAIDLMDRTAGHAGWMVVKPFFTATSNCILPTDVVNEFLSGQGPATDQIESACDNAYNPSNTFKHIVDPITNRPYVHNPDPVNLPGYAGFDSTTAPNNGEGFTKNIGGNDLPNAPHFTTSLSADYTMPVSEDWAATLHSDFYWQSQSWWRIFNDKTYDKLRGYSNVNLALILTSAGGWQVMGYLKNVFDTTAITGAFLNSDDTALTTNVFTTDPRLYGVRVTKTF